ncbi:MAG: hypothetical protein ACUVXI_03430 [bacterium]
MVFQEWAIQEEEQLYRSMRSYIEEYVNGELGQFGGGCYNKYVRLIVARTLLGVILRSLAALLERSGEEITSEIRRVIDGVRRDLSHFDRRLEIWIYGEILADQKVDLTDKRSYFGEIQNAIKIFLEEFLKYLRDYVQERGWLSGNNMVGYMTLELWGKAAMRLLRNHLTEIFSSHYTDFDRSDPKMRKGLDNMFAIIIYCEEVMDALIAAKAKAGENLMDDEMKDFLEGLR